MKNTRLNLLILIVLLFTACSDNKNDNIEKEKDTLSVTPTELDFSGNDTGTKTVTVETNVNDWKITQSVDWIQIVDREANKFSVAVEKNGVTGVRTGNIIVKAGEATPVTVTVKQFASDAELSVSPTELEFTSIDTEKKTVMVNTNVGSWNVTPSADWLIISKETNKFFVEVERNYTENERTGTITVTAGNAESKIVTVTQTASSASDWANDPNLRVLKAFPGAEGFGANVTGGRGGTVYFVTSLDDTNTGNATTREGTLRWCLGRSGAKTIVFKVSGIIWLTSRPLNITSNTTIAGQTAPGDGICIANYDTYINGQNGVSNVIVRYVRFRMGDLQAFEGHAFWGRNSRDIIIDHCSISWGTDETASFYDNDNFTMQWCMISESLRTSVHTKGNHGYGGIWGGRKASFHHNLLAHHDSRNPRFCGSRYSNRESEELVDFRNNVIYNWGANSGYAGEGGRYNMVNNYYKPGSGTGNYARIFQPNDDDGTNNQAAGVWGKFYVAGNYMLNRDGTPNSTVINDNWTAIHPNPHSGSKNKEELKSTIEFDKGEITTHTAQQAYELVLADAGASFRRDATDTRVLNEVRNGLTPVRATGGDGTRAGMIDTQTDVGGWDTYNSAPAPLDTDGDGIPDEWEIANGLNPNDPSDSNSTSLSGGTYTNLEVYLYDLLRRKP